MALTNDKSRLPVYTHTFSSPIGTLYGAVDRTGRVLYLGFTPYDAPNPSMAVEENKYACGELEYQLDQYFAGSRTAFDVDIRLDGTGFQKTVWSRLMKIGFGQTMTYGEVARKIGRRDAARAVGNAVAANPVIVLVPCHRVVPAGGGLGHYASRSLDEREGRQVKRLLLEMEAGQGILTE